MKYLLLGFIIFYQKFLSIVLKNLLGISGSCRFSPTCSEYAKQSILEKGAITGSLLTIQRLAKCQPFYPAFSGLVK
ncbi:MAG: membrane protein insertion efficiency factor YidD [Patescibacteria group bacterium]